MRKHFVLFLIICLAGKLMANMAEPVVYGTIGASPFTHQYVDILQENLLIIPASDFKTAQFEVEYMIRSDSAGVRIPLIFYALDYEEDFIVSMDGQPLELLPVPPEFEEPEGTQWVNFEHLLDTGFRSYGSSILVNESASSGFYIGHRDLLYFETDIPEGEHKIRVKYTAKQWIFGYEWVNKYGFRYLLSPAEYWRSFGSLHLTIDATSFPHPVETNLGQPTEGDLNGLATWKFDEMPVNSVEVTYQPEVNGTARFFMKLTPAGMAGILALIIGVLHFVFLIRWRNRHPAPRFSWVAIVGAIILPLPVFICWIWFFDVVDGMIGPDASREHGYTFLVMILYPITMPPYLIVTWLTDWFLKRRIQRKNEIPDDDFA